MSMKRRWAPSAQTWSVRQGQGRQGITVRGRDFYCSVADSDKGSDLIYKERDVPFYPTDGSMFPWMSKMAILFQTYKFLDLKFVFEPQCSSTTPGVVAMYFNPDPTSVKPVSWSDITQTGVNVHGSVWAKHILSVPQSMCSSRREYYVKDKFESLSAAFNDVTGKEELKYDPLEYFAGRFGFKAADFGNATGLVFGKIYVEYLIVFGKANDSTQAAATAKASVIPFVSLQTVSIQDSKDEHWFRNSNGVAISGSQVLIGYQQADNLSLGQQIQVGYGLLDYQDDGTLVANGPVEIKFVISLDSLTGNWTSEPLVFEIRPLGALSYTASATGTLTIGGQEYMNRRYDVGVGGTTYMALWSCRLGGGDAIRLKLSASPGSSAWKTASPGYSIRCYSATYNGDISPI